MADLLVSLLIAAVVGVTVGQSNPAAGATAFASVFGAIFAVLDRRRERLERLRTAAPPAAPVAAPVAPSAAPEVTPPPAVLAPAPPPPARAPMLPFPRGHWTPYVIWTAVLAIGTSWGTYPIYATPADDFTAWESLASLLWLGGIVAVPVVGYRLARNPQSAGLVGSVVMGAVVGASQALLWLIYETMGIPADPELGANAGELGLGMVVVLVIATAFAGWVGSRVRGRRTHAYTT